MKQRRNDWERHQLRQDLCELGTVLALIVIVFVVGWWLLGRDRVQAQELGPVGVTVESPVGAPQTSAQPFHPGITMTPRTCTLHVPMIDYPMPPGYEGAKLQVTRNGQNHARSDSSAPYGPFTSTVDRGEWTVRVTVSKSGMPTFEAPLGTFTCG